MPDEDQACALALRQSTQAVFDTIFVRDLFIERALYRRLLEHCIRFVTRHGDYVMLG